MLVLIVNAEHFVEGFYLRKELVSADGFDNDFGDELDIGVVVVAVVAVTVAVDVVVVDFSDIEIGFGSGVYVVVVVCVDSFGHDVDYVIVVMGEIEV